MKFETKFDIGKSARIKELNRDGIVIGIFVDTEGVQYRVRYFDNAKPESVLFYEWELEYK